MTHQWFQAVNTLSFDMSGSLFTAAAVAALFGRRPLTASQARLPPLGRAVRTVLLVMQLLQTGGCAWGPLTRPLAHAIPLLRPQLLSAVAVVSACEALPPAGPAPSAALSPFMPLARGGQAPPLPRLPTAQSQHRQRRRSPDPCIPWPLPL